MSGGVRLFNPSGYEILDARLASHGEVVIWSTLPDAPDLGEVFTLEPAGVVVDVMVVETTRVEGGWVARCHRTGAHPDLVSVEIAS